MASRLFYCPCEECSDEAISVGLVRMEIATPRQVGARNDILSMSLRG